MPQRKTAKKELKKDEKRKALNLIKKQQIKQTIKKFKIAVQDNNLSAARQNISLVYKALDKAVAKTILHPNKAARKKSRMTKLLNSIKKASGK